MKTLELSPDEILIPADRLRAIDENHAKARAASIKENGQLQPIRVKKTPPATKPFKPYTLVFGGHRWRAAQILGVTVRAEVGDLSELEAKIIEIEENLSRRDLTVLDRALFIARRRELHEEKHGEIKRGGAQKANLALWSDELTEVADRVGLSTRTLKRADQIARNLQPVLRQRLAGEHVPESQLLKLAKMEPERQKKIAASLKSGDALGDAINATETKPKAKTSDTQRRLQTVVNAFAKMNAKERKAALQQLIRDYPDDTDWALEHPRPEPEAK